MLLALLLPQPSEARARTQFEGFGLLLSRDVNGLQKITFRGNAKIDETKLPCCSESLIFLGKIEGAGILYIIVSRLVMRARSASRSPASLPATSSAAPNRKAASRAGWTQGKCVAKWAFKHFLRPLK